MVFKMLISLGACIFSNTQSSSVMHITSQYSGAACRAIHSQASARVIVTNSDVFDVKTVDWERRYDTQ